MSAENMTDTQRFQEGYRQGLAGTEFKGHHTAAFTSGWNSGNTVRDNMLRLNPSKYGYTQGIADGQVS